MKKAKALIVFLLLIVTLCFMSSCGTAGSEESASGENGGNDPSVKYTGIVSAMQREVDLLLEEAVIDHVDKIGGVQFHVGTLNGKNVVIARAGMGKVQAASGITSMLNTYPIERVFFTGIAGAVGDDTEVLDQVIATKLVQHDYGQITNEGFEWTRGNVGEDGYYYCDEKLIDLAYDSAVKIMGEEHVFKGVIATGDQFVASEEYVKILKDDFEALACEMEGAAVAMVCVKYEVPFVVIRTLSDKADGLAHDSYDNMADIAADNSNKIIVQMMSEG